VSGRVSRRWIVGRLVASGLLTPRALFTFAGTAAGKGVNLGSLLAFAARRYGDKPALAADGETLSFAELARQCEAMAAALRDAHGVRRGHPVGILARNGAGIVRAVFAAGRLGARVTLLNPEMSALQLAALVERHRIALVIVEEDIAQLVAGAQCRTVSPADLLASAPAPYRRIGRVAGGELVVLTGGTTGAPKAARRKPSVGAFLRLFLHLVAALGLDRYPSAYVGVPLFHGYGIAALLVALTLGRTVHLGRRFEARAACGLVERERLQAVVVVPSMLRRMLNEDGPDLSSLRCVVCGGAALPAQLAIEARERLGDVLFNLYGTSEGGVAVFAAPGDLARHPDTIGREIWGVRVTLRDERDAPVPDGTKGRLCVESSAAVDARGWIETGDVAVRGEDGLLFVRGRVDDMIVSGGENVSPWEVESVLATHPEVREAAAVGVPDPDFGQRLVAFVVRRPGTALDEAALASWLAERVARYQRPRAITLCDALPLTPIGKVDRRALVARAVS
jgi:fatty-acyl-CoA synthase